MNDVRNWLESLGLTQYVDAFESNDVDLDVLPSLNEGDLEKLGVSLGHRKKVLRAVAALGGGVSDVAATVARPVPANIAPENSSPVVDVTSTGERRQLTVMFCDLVGSTALSEKLDPEELRGLLHDYRTVCGEVIARYEGFVARYVGDGILTYFGWPKAHEEDAERTLRAALEIVQAVKLASSSETLSVRIGIATGPVVVGEQAGVGDQSKLAIGSTPNLAARLQGLASADQIILANSTRRLVGYTFELVDLGEHDLKGIAEPVHAWRVESVSAAVSRFDAATLGAITPMFGREQELGLLIDRWQQAQQSEGQVVLLSGEPGIGKSRLMSTLRERLEDQGAQSLRFQCSPYHINSAYYPSIDRFERTLKFSRDDTPDAKLDKLEALIVKQLSRPLSDVRFIASILSIPYEQRYGALPMTPQKFKDETLRTLVDLSEAAARKQPTVMLFEDAHWADPTSLEVLDLLIDRTKTIPLLIVLTHRPEFQPKWGSHGHVTALNLSKLTRAQSTAIIDKLTQGKELPTGLLDQILNKTDGVPLYVEELTKSILESSELKNLGDRYDYQGTERRVTIPATLRDSLTARLDRDPLVKEIAQIGSAIGREFSYELIQAVAPHSPEHLHKALTQLTESGLAFRRGTPPEATYVFKHALVQDAAYEMLLKTKRRELHGQIANVIIRQFPSMVEVEPELLGHHFTAARMPDAAIPYWTKAGQSSMQRFAMNESIAHLNSGVELLNLISEQKDRDVKELDLRSLLGAAWMVAGGWVHENVRPNIERAFELAMSLQRYEMLPGMFVILWVNTNSSGRTTDALDVAHRAQKLGEQIDSRIVRMVGYYLAMISLFWQGQHAKAQESKAKMISLYREEEDRAQLLALTNHDVNTILGLYTAQWTWILGYPEQAIAISDTKDANARIQGNAFDIGFALGFGSFVYSYTRNGEALLSRSKECAEIGRNNNLPFLTHILAALSEACALIDSGQTEEGVEKLKAYVTSANAIPALLPYLKACLAEQLVNRGADKDAIEFIDQALEQIGRPGWGERVHLAEVLRVRGRIFLLKGDLEEAEQNYLASLDVAREQQAKSWELRTSTSLAQLWQSQGKRKEAHNLLAPVYNWFTEGFDTKDLIEAKALLGELA